MSDQEIVQVEMVAVESPNVAAIGYHSERVILAIEMNDGHLYYYLDVPIEHYEGMLKCNQNIPGELQSIGAYMRLNLKGNYRYIRIK